MIQKQRGDIGAVEDVLKIVRCDPLPVERFLQLAVERDQFFVERLQLLFRGQQLFVGGLKLLVDRQGFVIDGLLFQHQRIAGLAGLGQFGMGGFQLAFQFAHLCVAILIGRRRAGVGRCGLFDETDQMQRLAIALDKADCDGEHHRRAVHAGLAQVGLNNRAITVGARQGIAQGAAQIIGRQRQQIQRRRPAGNPQITADRADRIDAFALRIDQQAGRAKAVQHRIAAQIGQHRLPGQLLFGFQRGEPRNAFDKAERKAVLARLALGDVAIDPFGLVQHGEPFGGIAGGFGHAQHQHTIFAQGKMEQADHLGLGFGLQIDQQVAAGYQIHPRKGRVGQDILHGEHHRSAQRRGDAVTAILFHEIAGQPFGRDFVLDRQRIQPFARDRDGLGINIRCKDLQFDVALFGHDRIAQDNRQRIGLFAGAASCHPDAQRLVVGKIGEQIGDDAAFQQFEHRRIAKEAGDVDQQVFGQRAAFVVVAGQLVTIARQCARRQSAQAHAAVNAPFQRAALVGAEILPGLVMQQRDDGLDVGGFVFFGLV